MLPVSTLTANTRPKVCPHSFVTWRITESTCFRAHATRWEPLGRVGMPLYKFVAGKLLVWLENKAFGLEMTDYHSGFLLYSRRAIETIPFERLSSYFDFDLEVIACAQARGLKVAELGILTRYADELSHLNPIWCGVRCLLVLLRYRLGRYRAGFGSGVD